MGDAWYDQGSGDGTGVAWRVNVIRPRPIQTAMLVGDLDYIAPSVPISRLGQSAASAPMVVYLMVNESGYLTGADLSIDGAVTV